MLDALLDRLGGPGKVLLVLVDVARVLHHVVRKHLPHDIRLRQGTARGVTGHGQPRVRASGRDFRVWRREVRSPGAFAPPDRPAPRACALGTARRPSQTPPSSSRAPATGGRTRLPKRAGTWSPGQSRGSTCRAHPAAIASLGCAGAHTSPSDPRWARPPRARPTRAPECRPACRSSARADERVSVCTLACVRKRMEEMCARRIGEGPLADAFGMRAHMSFGCGALRPTASADILQARETPLERGTRGTSSAGTHALPPR
eukprot:5724256-Prymnesium_polylepis.2